MNIMNKHEELVRQIAEEMAKIDDKFFETYMNNRGFYHSVINERITAFTPFARIAVKHMAEQFTKGFSFAPHIFWSNINNHLREYGLIPPAEKEEEYE